MAFTAQDLAAVDAAIASGELTIRAADGKTVTYRSMSELREARSLILDDLRAASPAAATRPRTRHFTFATQRERS